MSSTENGSSSLSPADRSAPGIKAVLLVGGMGTRLRSVVSSTPKVLARIGGRSFLELLVRQLRAQGIRRVLMCTGYLADQIEDEFGDGSSWDTSIEYSRELSAAGTGGALKLAEAQLADAPDFLVLNGDSFLQIDFLRLIAFHRKHAATVTLAVREVDDVSRYGSVQIDATGRVLGFTEKTGRNIPGLINAGVYVFNHSIFEHLAQGPSSLERELFPRLLKHGIYALEERGIFIDIGTPDSYARAQGICDQLYDVALQRQG
jgi:D-glycero-alpha-D-manno-heptose 1-phosphate guanylyltransferase